MRLIPAKTIISGYAEHNDWFGCNYSMNIYKGCCHGCIYCDSRSECYRIDDFDEVRAKENALEIIERELKAKRKKGVIGTGAMSDPYNPLEREHQLTRGALELIRRYGFGVAIATKSSLVARDADVLKDISRHAPVLVKITITTCDDSLSAKLEPHVARSSERFAALRRLTDQGIFAGVLLMPVLPFIEDTHENIAGIVKLAGENGARFIYPAFGVTLRQNQREWFYAQLDKHFPGIREKYEKTFGDAYSCHSPRSRALYRLLSDECRNRGMLYKMEDIIRDYKMGYGHEQMSLYDCGVISKQ